MNYALLLLSIISSTVLCLEWKTPQDIGFEIRNHESYPITVSLTDYFNPKAYAFKDVYLPGKTGKNIASLKKALDINNPYKLTLQYATNTGYVTKTYLLSGINKTLFVAWENEQLRPQQGIFGKTQSGLSLKRNLTKKDISLLPSDDAYGEL
jgi:hypothetical protein